METVLPSHIHWVKTSSCVIFNKAVSSIFSIGDDTDVVGCNFCLALFKIGGCQFINIFNASKESIFSLLPR